MPRVQLGKLAFVKGGDIWVKELPDGEARQLTRDGRNGEPRWSPSGEWLTFAKDAGADGAQLWVIRGSGGEPRLVGSAPRARAFWSPVSDRFAYTTRTGVVMEDADGSYRREISARVQGDLSWGPDGTWLAYARTDVPVAPGERMPGDRRGSIWRVRPDGSDARVMLDGGSPSPGGFMGGFMVAGWSPDGSLLLYWTNPMFSASGLADGSALMAVPVDGGQPREMAKKMLLHRDFLSWSPSGRELALVDGSYRSSWYRKHLAVSDLSGPARPLSEPSRADLFPSWSPDGRVIAYTGAPAVETDGGNEARQASWQRRIWVMQPDGSGKRQVTNDPTYRDERPIWSRDGIFILFGRMIDDQMQLWLMCPDGSDLKQVVDEMTPLPDPVAGWFGYYGYLYWDRMYDWWQGGSEALLSPESS
ncbi:MAG: TolB family protein [Chloroflexota bacterium]